VNVRLKAGQREMEVQQFERALALLPSDAALDSNQMERLMASLRQKIDRLKQER
jgi:hypothetical protein